jgi:hypothetical protein
MLDGPRKNSAALAHTPPVPSYLTGLNDDDEDEDDDEDDDDDRDQDPDEWLDSEDEYSSSSSSKPKDIAGRELSISSMPHMSTPLFFFFCIQC